MRIQSAVRSITRKLGIDLVNYTPQLSTAARMKRLFDYHAIDLVLDVGANRGQYGLILRDFGYSGRIVSFEPLSSAYQKLTTTSKNDPLWKIAPRTAIGNQDGEITINIAANSESSSVLEMLEPHLEAVPNSVYCGSETVKISRLDTIADKYIDREITSIFLKIDVQGLEKQVIEGACNILHRIKGIQLELSLVHLYTQELLFQEMLSFVESLGYELHGLIPGFTNPKTGRMLQMDGIFFKP